KTFTRANPATCKVCAALAERLSVLQTSTIGPPSSPASSANRPASSATGILRAVAMWPSVPVNSSGPRTSTIVTASPWSSRRLSSLASIQANGPRSRSISRSKEPGISLIRLPHPKRIAAGLATERLQQHPVEPELAGITELLDPNSHRRMPSRRLGAISPQQPVPPSQVKPEIAVGLAPQNRMMDAMHVRRHDEPSQDA